MQYKEKKMTLEAKKESLYPKMDLGEWKIDQDNLEISKQELINNKSLAKKYMLPKVSSVSNLL